MSNSFQPDPKTAMRATTSTFALMQGDKMTRRSADSAAMLPYWDLTDAIVEGIEGILQNLDDFLPKFTNETEDTYSLRKQCLKFTNVYRDIVEGLASKPFEEEVSLVEDKEKNIPESVADFIENVDGSGNNLTEFAGSVFFNGINSAIHWIYIDYPNVAPGTIKNRADQKAAGVRPFWSHVLGRNVLEVRSAVVNGNEELTYIRIYEPGEPDCVRIFRKVGDVVNWELWEKKENNTPPADETNYVLIYGGTLSIKVIPLVPFWTGRRNGRTWRFYPAMRDAADLSKVLFRQESGLEYQKTMSNYAMLAANGLKPPMDGQGKPLPVAIGPSRILWGVPDAAGNHGEWKWIAPPAENMKFAAEDIKTTKQDLRELGRQPLTAQSGNLTVITTAVAAGKARSAVGAWALILKNSLENALVITAMWLSLSTDEYDPEVHVYDEFDQFTDDGKDVDALNTMRKNGDISQDTYWNEMKRRRVLSPEFDADEERELLLAETPSDMAEDDEAGNSNGLPNPQDDPPEPGNGNGLPNPAA